MEETGEEAGHVGETRGSQTGGGAAPPSVELGCGGATLGQASWWPQEARPRFQGPKPPLGYGLHSVDIFIEHLLCALAVLSSGTACVGPGGGGK